MKTATLPLFFAAAVALPLAHAQPHADAPPAQASSNIPKGMKKYFIGLLVKGAKYDDAVPKEERERLQQQHLAYMRSQGDAGKLALAGPFLDNDRFRGLLVINAASAEEAQVIANGDPAVKIGRLAVEIHPFMAADLSCAMVEFEKNRAK